MNKITRTRVILIRWRHGVVVSGVGRSTKLIDTGPG